jgi:hypothetical protein
MSYAIPLRPRPHLDHYKKLARELLRVPSSGEVKSNGGGLIRLRAVQAVVELLGG